MEIARWSPEPGGTDGSNGHWAAGTDSLRSAAGKSDRRGRPSGSAAIDYLIHVYLETGFYWKFSHIIIQDA